MALVADSFHMLSDIISLAVGYFALRFSTKRDVDVSKTGNTYGWVRAGVLGALINAVFLIALCLSIFISAIQRFVDAVELKKPILILTVGAAGLLVNILGMFLFHGHAHSHGCGHGHAHGGGGGHGHKEHGHSHKDSHGHNHKNHGHSHNGHGHTHGRKGKDSTESNGSVVKQRDIAKLENGHVEINANSTNLTVPSLVNYQCPPDSPSLRRFQERARDVETLFVPLESTQINIPPSKNKIIEEEHSSGGADKSGEHLNMKGVYLHILGDALGSVVVIIAALIVHFCEGKWTWYIDPALSVFMVLIILNSSVPLLKESSMILLQNVPSHIELKKLEDRLLESFPEILSVHEFHVWQLAGNKIIASVHVKFGSRADYVRLATNLKEFFHCEGIHSTTFQPEFQDQEEKVKDAQTNKCLLSCVSKSCEEKVCCLPSPDTEKKILSSVKNEGGDKPTDNHASDGHANGQVNLKINVVDVTIDVTDDEIPRQNENDVNSPDQNDVVFDDKNDVCCDSCEDNNTNCDDSDECCEGDDCCEDKNRKPKDKGVTCKDNVGFDNVNFEENECSEEC